MLNDFWESSFHGGAPIAHELKNIFTNRWVRFHSLPESKRYPTRESEYNEILSRYNQVISDLCNDNHPVYIVMPAYSDKIEHPELGEEVKDLLENPVYWQSVPMHDPDEDIEFHPYDGGADIVLRDEHEKTKLKNKYSNWLSSHPKGL